MKLVAILPLLMLCVAGCSTVPQPSVLPAGGAAKGNAYRLLLPEGTQIALPDEHSYREVAAIAYNELAVGASLPARSVALARPLQLVSPAYIAQRNAGEMALLKAIDELKEENARLRARP